MKVSCIIPAYNEEKSIVTTLNTIIPLLNWDLFEIIIINDCSNDQTQDILNSYPVQKNLHLVHNTNNLGKSATVSRGIELAKGDYILLLDADLLHLTKQNIIDLIAPIKSWKSRSSIAFIKNSRPLPPFKKIDYCNGQRVIPATLLKENIWKISNLLWYGLEIFLNQLLIQNKISLASVHRDNVENDFHQNKDGLIKGRIKNLKIWRHILYSAWGLFALYKMNFDLQTLLKE